MTQAGTIIRVYCVDGPCQGLQYLDANTRRILFRDEHDGQQHIYRLNQSSGTATGSDYPHASYQHSEPANRQQRPHEPPDNH